MLHLKSLTMALALTLLPAAAMAIPVYGSSVGSNLIDSRTSAAGQIQNAGAGSASLSWSISDNLNGTYHYAYTLTTTAQNTISHFILDLSDNCTAAGSCFSNLVVTAPDSYDGLGFASYSAGGSNPSMPGTIVGVKLDNTVSTDGIFAFAFDSDRMPVWGDFYSKGGNVGSQPSKAFAVWNTGLADHASDDILDFIAVPDTILVCDPRSTACGPPPCTANCGPNDVPEPSSMALLGAGLAGLLGIRRRRRQA